MNTISEQSKIAVRLHGAEFEFVGTESFIERKLPELLERLVELVRDIETKSPDSTPLGVDPTAAPSEAPFHRSSFPSLSINSVIAKLGGGSCRAILLASAAQLTFIQGKERFSREEIVALAKEASAYKRDYSSQTARDFSRLVKSGEFIENAKDIFCLSDEKRAELASRLS